jgi:hypothetical protein
VNQLDKCLLLSTKLGLDKRGSIQRLLEILTDRNNPMTDDLEYFDGLEAVTLTIGANAYTIQALRRPLTARMNGGTPIERAAWHVRVADLSGDNPAPGNLLEVGAEQWNVVEVERLSLGTRYRLICERV